MYFATIYSEMVEWISNVPSEDLLGRRIGLRISLWNGALTIVLPMHIILLVLMGCPGGVMRSRNDLGDCGLECPDYSTSPNVHYDSSDMQRRNIVRQCGVYQGCRIHLRIVTHHRPWHTQCVDYHTTGKHGESSVKWEAAATTVAALHRAFLGIPISSLPLLFRSRDISEFP